VSLCLTIYTCIGPVAAGYGRGSKKLGFPTANLPYFDDILQSSDIKNGTKTS
jgi:FAD synthase